MLKIDSQTQTLWCYCIGSVTVVKREREGGRRTSGSDRQLVNEVGVGHRDARPLGQRGRGGGWGPCSGQTVQLFALPPSGFKNVLRTNFN